MYKGTLYIYAYITRAVVIVKTSFIKARRWWWRRYKKRNNSNARFDTIKLSCTSFFSVSIFFEKTTRKFFRLNSWQVFCVCSLVPRCAALQQKHISIIITNFLENFFSRIICIIIVKSFAVELANFFFSFFFAKVMVFCFLVVDNIM